MTGPAAYPRPELPRLHFTGRFFTDPGTVNNDVLHYDVANFRPNWQLLSDELNDNGRFSPGGNSTFAFVDCKVRSVKTVKSDNLSDVPDETADPVIGKLIIGNQQSVYGKISDMDPQHQGISRLYGVRVNLCSEDDDACLSAVLRPCSQRDAWQSATEYADGVAAISAVFQGALAIDKFVPGNSLFLQECAEYVEQSKTIKGPDGKALYPNGAMSMRFRVSDYDNNPSQKSTFRYGRTVGYITPWLPGFPERFDAGRILRPVSESHSSASAYAQIQQVPDEVDQYSILVDMINSLERTSMTQYKDIGHLYLAFIPTGSSLRRKADYHLIRNGEINYRVPDWEHATGGVFEVRINSFQKRIFETKQLAIVAVKDDVGTILLAEPADGLFPRADFYGYALNPYDTIHVDFYLTQFGKRLSNAPIKIGFDSARMNTTGLVRGEGPTPGIPVSALTIAGTTPCDEDPDNFVTTVTTDRNGFVRVPIVGGDCGNPRGYIDGQMYGLRFTAGNDLPPLDPYALPNERVTIKLFNVYKAPETPSWLGDVYPIFKQYANLYPGMDRVVSLDDYGSVVEKRDALQRAFNAPEDDPRYMPTVRDLSKAKREMILKWLTRDPNNPSSDPLYMNIHKKSDLFIALQTVIELEHATMPPYLTALYSIKQGTNQYIEDTLRDIAIEEMLHFAIAANILTAIGGHPNIKQPAFVPKFPGPLPGGLRRGLIVGLSKCTIPQLKAFMSLEAPDTERLDDDEDIKSREGRLQTNKYTIAFLYDLIKESIKELHNQPGPEGIKFPDDLKLTDSDKALAYQVTGPWPDKLEKIRTIDDALEGIEVIKEQGEGASPTKPSEGTIDPETGLPVVAHYFRFAEIIKGRRLVYNENGDYEYSGPKIELDEHGVYNMRENPKIETLPPSSLARERMEAFSRKYQALLNALHRTFNGEPKYLTDALACMHQLTMDAKPLMQMPMINMDGTPTNDGTTVGVSFQVPFADM